MANPAFSQSTTPRRSQDDTTSMSASGDLEKASSHQPDEDTPQHTNDHDPNFLVSFTGDDDPRCPKSMGTLRKWLIVLIVSSTSLCVAGTSSLYVGTYAQLEEEWNSSEVVVTLGLSMFVVGLGLSPMVLAPLSEFYGRKPVYIGSMILFVIWIIPSAVAQNMATMIVSRFFDGFFGAAFLSVAGGTVGDLFPRTKLAAPMMLYTLSPFLGPQLGPLISDFINYNVSWRWTFWVALIWAFVQWAAIVLFVPETYHPVILRNMAIQKRKETGDERYYAPLEKMDRSITQTILRSCYRPFLLLALEPMCLALCVYCSVLLGVLYLFFGAFGLVFRENHGFKLWQVGLTFLGITVGMIAAAFTNPFWARNYRRLLARHEKENGVKGGSEPEFRLPPAIGGSPFVVIGLFWFGWTTYSSVHWIVPIIGSAFFGAGVIMIFSGVFTFLVDAYPLYAASALAANSFSRSMFAAAFPLFGPAMYRNLGFQWASFVLAMITLAMAPFPWIFYRYGKQIRARSKYAGNR